MKNLLENFEFSTAKDKIEILFYYFNDSTMISTIVFALSVLYICLTEKNKKIKDLFVWYVLAILLIVWNPFIVYMLEDFINFSSLYRLYYMFPMYPVIAYAFTKIVMSLNQTWKKLLCIVLISAVVIIFGKNVYQEWPLLKYHNLYKLPDETVFAADAIYDDEKYEHYKKAIVPYGMSSQIQQIHPSIKLLYTRFITNISDESGMPSPADTDDPGDNEIIKRINDGDTKYIAELCEREEINYVVLYDVTILQQPLENFGFEKIASDYRSNSL